MGHERRRSRSHLAHGTSPWRHSTAGHSSARTEADMIHVSVLIPTFRRPDSFVRAVRSVFAQRGVTSFEIVAIDNSPEGSAVDTLRRIAAESPVRFVWAHEPKP